MRDELYDGLKALAKKNHRDRVAKNPDRIAYAIEQFEALGIRYELKNSETGHFHAWDINGHRQQFWASTGKILAIHRRGIHSFIKILKGE